MDYEYLYNKFSEDGFIKVEEFFTESEVANFERGAHEVMENVPTDDVLLPSFSAPTSQFDEYYLNSVDKIAYFFEPGAFHSAENISVSDVKDAVSKVGYALHWWNPEFKKMTFCEKIKDLLKNFACKNPLVTDSQLTFKKSKKNEVSYPHQISTFLYTNPPTALGIWIPLEDADVESGCLWFLPGSHKGEIFQRFVKNPDNVPLVIMKGKIPESKHNSYVPVPVKKEEDAEWSEENWLQPTGRLPFPSVYAN